MMAAERSEWKKSAPHDAFESRHLYSIVYVAFQESLIDCIQKLNRWTLSQSGGISDFNIKCSTKWVSVGERREISVTLIMGAFIFIRKGKEKTGAVCPGTGIPPLLTFLCRCYLELTCTSPCRDDIVWELRMSLNVKESEKSCGAVERHADPPSLRDWDFKCNVFLRTTCCRTWKKRLRHIGCQVNIVVF